MNKEMRKMELSQKLKELSENKKMISSEVSYNSKFMEKETTVFLIQKALEVVSYSLDDSDDVGHWSISLNELIVMCMEHAIMEVAERIDFIIPEPVIKIDETY